MGGGSWSTSDFVSYSTTRGRSVDLSTGSVTGSYSNQEMYKSTSLVQALNPYKVTRECRDTEEHPNTIPVILALDVTGSMGESAVEIAKKLNTIMTKLYESVTDIEFMVMGIGDLYCDYYPIQASQFESDIRIAEQMEQIYFEFGGGGNDSESYTASWYFGLYHTDLDCWKRGKKGLIITIGDELLNPFLQKESLIRCTGDDVSQFNLETQDLYNEAKEKFDIFHIHVDHGSQRSFNTVAPSWLKVIGDHLIQANLDNVAEKVTDIILNTTQTTVETSFDITNDILVSKINTNENGEIVW
jgi:hypothetical protein